MSDEDWESYIKKIKRIESHKVFSKPSKSIKNKPAIQSPIFQQNPKDYNLTFINSLNRSKIRKLQNETVEASIDLHGLTLIQAEQAFINFINKAVISGKRNVLVITGKGKFDFENKEVIGKIKLALPLWVDNLKHLIKFFISAPPNLGGEGAFIIRLRE